MLMVDMDMPKSCFSCPLCYDFLYCPITETRTDDRHADDERLPDCPLKESEEKQ